ncbi:hypothetical protein [Pseudoxanthomonas mexicana]
MGLTPQQYAYLADHSYDRGGQMQDLLNKDVVIGGERYRVIDHSGRAPVTRAPSKMRRGG